MFANNDFSTTLIHWKSRLKAIMLRCSTALASEEIKWGSKYI
jgi:hypothetical protein